MVLKQDKEEKFVVERDQKYGGNLEYSDYEEIEKDFKNKKLKKYFDYGEMIFKCIIGQFKKIGNIVFVQKRIFMKNLSKMPFFNL